MKIKNLNQDEKRIQVYLTCELVNFNNTLGYYNLFEDNNIEVCCLFKIGVGADVGVRIDALKNKWRYNIKTVIFAVECENSQQAKQLEDNIKKSVSLLKRKQVINETIMNEENEVIGNIQIDDWTRNAYTEWFTLNNEKELNEIIKTMKLASKIELKEWENFKIDSSWTFKKKKS